MGRELGLTRATPATNPATDEPFGQGRETARLLYDFGAMASCMKPEMRREAVLDFGAGTGWISEFLARMGFRVTAFDIHGDLENCLAQRTASDVRIDGSLMSFAHGDGHAMPFADQSFGQLLCYDTLHHMHDFDAVFAEFARVLKPGGRAIFVEPGATHSTNPYTVAAMAQADFPDGWIERDIVIEEIDGCAARAGFADMQIVPMQHPSRMMTFPIAVWRAYRAKDERLRAAVADEVSDLNYNDRVVFYFDMGDERAPAAIWPSNVRRLSRLYRAGNWLRVYAKHVWITLRPAARMSSGLNWARGVTLHAWQILRPGTRVGTSLNWIRGTSWHYWLKLRPAARAARASNWVRGASWHYWDRGRPHRSAVARYSAHYYGRVRRWSARSLVRRIKWRVLNAVKAAAPTGVFSMLRAVRSWGRGRS